MDKSDHTPALAATATFQNQGWSELRGAPVGVLLGLMADELEAIRGSLLALVASAPTLVSDVRATFDPLIVELREAERLESTQPRGHA